VSAPLRIVAHTFPLAYVPRPRQGRSGLGLEAQRKSVEERYRMGGVSHVEFCEILRRTKPNGASPPQAANANAKADSDGPVRRLRTDAATDEKAPTASGGTDRRSAPGFGEEPIPSQPHRPRMQGEA
jgi:hypothetical protein